MSAPPSGNRAPTPSDEARALVWEQALNSKQLPSFVVERLADAGAGRRPWISTLSPSALLLAKSHGMKPVATVSGNCCYQFGWSWTDAQPTGWALAQERIRAEAAACGAHAVVEVRLSIQPSVAEASMDFTMVGTAVRLKAPLSGSAPLIATVSALEFVRLAERGIVPVGLVVGARYARYFDQSVASNAALGARNYYAPFGSPAQRLNRDLTNVGKFWEGLRRGAHADLQRRAIGVGTGVLAKVHWSQLDRLEPDSGGGSHYVGRHVVLGTVIRARRGDQFAAPIASVIDMCDGPSPLTRSVGLDGEMYTDKAQRGVNE